jgi:hypothetical protein
VQISSFLPSDKRSKKTATRRVSDRLTKHDFKLADSRQEVGPVNLSHARLDRRGAPHLGRGFRLTRLSGRPEWAGLSTLRPGHGRQAGLIAMSGTSDPICAGLSPLPVLGNNLRFAGVWFGVGPAILWLVPRIDTQTTLFRAIWVMIFCGGAGRLISLLLVGMPPAPFIGFIVLENVGAPLFILWQARIAK